MDITETYIKMCKGALKDLRQYLHRDEDGCLSSTQPCGIDDDSGKLVPLFQQDQLQEMVGSYAEQCDYLGGYIDWDAKKQGWAFAFQFGCVSMEQLWLAFVMKEKYNKTWDGRKWCCGLSA